MEKHGKSLQALLPGQQTCPVEHQDGCAGTSLIKGGLICNLQHPKEFPGVQRFLIFFKPAALGRFKIGQTVFECGILVGAM